MIKILLNIKIYILSKEYYKNMYIHYFIFNQINYRSIRKKVVSKKIVFTVLLEIINV